MGNMDAKVHMFTSMALGRGRVGIPTLGRLYPGKAPTSYYRRLSGPQDQSGYEGVKNNLRSSVTQDRTRIVQSIGKRLALELPGPCPYLIVL